MAQVKSEIVCWALRLADEVLGDKAVVGWVLPLHENEGQDKRVESVWFPCADEGSTPSSSTIISLCEGSHYAT